AFKKLEQAPSNPCKFTPSSPLYEKALDGLLLQLHDMEQKYRELKLFCKNTQDEVKLKVRSCEMGFLERWIECDIRGIKDYTVAERLVEQLKIREMQLQVLILLEILAWKHEHADLTKNTPSPKSRKAKAKESVIDKNDPSLRLNICIDRLNLWHTLGPSFILDFLPQKEEVDFLRQFCLEIIMPFYESRIPEKCSSLYVKCGCNVNRSPKEKQKIIKDPLSALTIPPAPTPLPSSARLPRKPKTTFKSIPAPKRRQTNHLSKLAAREIEFKPLKRKQSANLREDLRAAINNIAKPNRMAIGAEIMEAREQRFRKGTPNKRYSYTVDSRKKDSLQVPATPSNRRTRPRQQDDQSRDLLSPPPKKLRLVSSPIIVEDTPVKSRHKSVSEDIRETPVKGTSRTHHLDQESPTKTSFSSTVALVASSPETVKSTKGIAKEEADIFDQLGWNDY
ncbi:DNA replication regulator sld3, partial [Neolecta irregularis DAH-3]